MNARQLAAKKSRNAIFEIALVYRNEGNTKAALEEYKKAITFKQQSPDAMFHLAAHYLLGQDVKADAAYALSLLEETAKLAHARAQLFAGYCYQTGLGTLANKVKAFDCYQKSAAMGDSEAAYLAGYCYENGVGVTVNKNYAFKYYELSAKEKNKNGLYHFGRCYDDGIGVKANKTQALLYYKQAAGESNLTLDGHTSAQAKLAEYYLLNSNHYSFKDSSNLINYGKKCLLLALTKGNSLAHYVMANCHEYGLHDYEKNKEKAILLYKKSALELDAAKSILKEMGESLNDESIVYPALQLIQQGKKLITEAKQKNNSLEYVKKAVSLFYQAAMLDDIKGQEFLANCYLKGIGVKKNLSQSLWWYRIVSYRNSNALYSIELINMVNNIKSDVSPLDEDFLILSASESHTPAAKSVDSKLGDIVSPRANVAVLDLKSPVTKPVQDIVLPDNYLKQLYAYVPFFQVAVSNKDELLSVIAEQKNQDKAKQERDYIFKSETLYDYYNLMIMQLEGIILAAKVIHSKMVENGQKSAADYVSMGIKEVGSHIPILSIGTSILSALINAVTERDKLSFVNALASYFNSISFSSKTAEELARLLTLLQEAELVKLAVNKPGFFKRLYLGGKKLINNIAANDIDNDIKEFAAKQIEVIINAVVKSKLGKVFSQDEIEKIIKLFDLNKSKAVNSVLPISPVTNIKLVAAAAQGVMSPVAAAIPVSMSPQFKSADNFSNSLKAALEKRGLANPIADSKLQAITVVEKNIMLRSPEEKKKQHQNEKEFREKRIYHENHLKYECLSMQAKIQAKRIECMGFLSRCVEKQKLTKVDGSMHFNAVYLLRIQEYLIVCYLGRTGEKLNVQLSEERPGDTEIRIVDRFLHDLMKEVGHNKLILLIENLSYIISRAVNHIYDEKMLESPKSIPNMKKLFSQGIIKAVQSGYFSGNGRKNKSLVKGKEFIYSILQNMISSSEESDFKKMGMMDKVSVYLDKMQINLSESFISESTKASENGIFGEVNKDGKVPLMLSPDLVKVLEREALRLSSLSA